MATILVIDNDPSICEIVEDLARQLGHRASSAKTLQQGLERSSSETFDLVFLNRRMPDGDGLGALARIREGPAFPEVILMMDPGDLGGTELGIQDGVWDFLQKPLLERAVSSCLIRALQYRNQGESAARPITLKREGIVGSSPRIKACLDVAAQVADSDASVLIIGETGTGKELFAWAIHANSRRTDKNFVVVDCASLPENLVESILFGHEKGAFTGADKHQTGLIQQANGGTLFLDEVGELPLSIQKSFLRVLHGKSFRPVGGKNEISCDFRLLAASNRNLDEMAQQGQFRNDLLFRIRSFQIELPPLRDRLEDLQELVMYYMAELCERYGMEKKEFSPEFFQGLSAYSWPGNVRELVNALERALVASRYERTVYPKHLPTHLRVKMALGSAESERTAGPETIPAGKPLPKLKALRRECVGELEKNYLKDLTAYTRGDIREACRISGLSRSRLYLLLKKHQIPPSG